jgi:hypothetical protein
MKKSLLVVSSLFVFGMLIATMTASAQTVTMNFISGEGNNSGGVYVFPYYFTINSGTHTNSLMCDTFNNEISNGESWSATILSVANLTVSNVGTTEFGSSGVQTYLEACHLYQEELAAYNSNNSDPEGLYNWAVWDLFTGTDPSGSRLSSGDETTVQGYLSAAEALGPSLDPSQFAGMYIITPTNNMAGGPQEFFGICSVPEPGTLALVGIGIMGMVAFVRRRG